MPASRHVGLLLGFAACLASAAGVAAAGETRRIGDAPSQAPDPASNMGFRLETTLAVSSGEKDGIIVALPLNLGTGDIADASAAIPCSGPAGPRADGVVDALDLACDLWTSQQGGLWVSRRVADPPGWQSRGAWRLPDGSFAHGGDWVDPIVVGEAVSVRILAPPSGGVVNDATIVGSHAPGLPCPVIDAPAGEPTVSLLNVFYHTMHRSASELLCGLQSMDWDDLDADGDPDRCDALAFDPSAGGHAAVVDSSGDVVLTRVVTADPSAPHGLRFTGPDFELIPGRGYLIVTSPEQPARTWCQPHF